MPRLFASAAVATVVAAFVAAFLHSHSTYVFDVANSQPFTPRRIALLSADKTIVVTGASSGLGLSATKLLAKAGTARLVIMACRNATKCEQVREVIVRSLEGGGNTTLVCSGLDLSSLAAVRDFADDAGRILGRGASAWEEMGTDDSLAPPPPLLIDVLINNAGVMGVQHSLSDETSAEIQMQTNHLGHFALTSLLLPNLLSSGRGRVVTVSSLMGSLPLCLRADDLGFHRWRWVGKAARSMCAYAASKRANLLFAHGLHSRYGNDMPGGEGRILSVAAHPGYTRTSLMLSGLTVLPALFGKFLHLNKVGSMDSDSGALILLRAALDDEKFVGGGSYVGPMWGIFGRPVVVGSALKSPHHLLWPATEADASDLWRASENAIGWEYWEKVVFPSPPPTRLDA